MTDSNLEKGRRAQMAESVSRSEQTVELEDRNRVARFGLILLATDLTSENDLYRIANHPALAVHATRIAYKNPTTPQNLRRMEPDLTAGADLLVPGEPLHAIVYSCTSASVVIGDDAVAKAIGESRPGVPVITPPSAAREALHALDANRLSILTPYTVETSESMAAYFAGHGFDILRFDCLGLDDDREMARISPQTIIEAACATVLPETEAIFISCTALPAIGCIDAIEQRTGKPVVTSNQASAWAMLRAGGLNRVGSGYGRLFDTSPPVAPPEPA